MTKTSELIHEKSNNWDLWDKIQVTKLTATGKLEADGKKFGSIKILGISIWTLSY